VDCGQGGEEIRGRIPVIRRTIELNSADRRTGTGALAIGYAVTIFLSAFLLFQIQPLISRYILPWFGGTPSVWTTCMLFFQVALFGGYAYAHLTTQRLAPRTQAVTHIVLMIAALLLLPITPSADWKPTGDEQPIVRIIALLSISVGLPFFVLSSTGPLLQGWFSRTHRDLSPYRLYALSNIGSLLALVSYPFAFEPAFEASLQASIWSWGFGSFAVLCAVCAVAMWKLAPTFHDDQTVPTKPASDQEQEQGTVGELEAAASMLSSSPLGPPPSWDVRFYWFALPMAASVMLLATTNQVCLDVASVPFLWVLPLTLYLASFILCFDSDRWYTRRLFPLAMAVTFGAVVVLMKKGAGASIISQISVYFSALFFCAMVCHGELVRLRPHPRYLTSFYLVISAGGAAGGILVGVLAPLLFSSYLELPIGMVGSAALMLAVLYRDPNGALYGGRPRTVWVVLLAGLFTLNGSLIWVHNEDNGNGIITVTRNFYGVLRVKELDADNEYWNRYTLVHGRILHGMQFADEQKRLEPTTYYGHESGVGLILDHHRPGESMRVGVVGLGTGTIAAYGRAGDSYRFYEINSEDVRLARTYFTYLKDLKDRRADVQVVLGDARLSMEREAPQHYDVLALDAFSSDAIPTHLLTREAIAVYLRHLKPDGVLAVHISNRHFNLRPVVEGLADHFHLTAVTITSDSDDDLETDDAEWVLLSRDPLALDIEAIQDVADAPQKLRILWTDNRSNLFDVLD